MRAQGLDVSHWQGAIDWQAVRNSGLGFALIKATEGDSYSDECFAANWQGAREAGLRCGAYHFFVPALDPLAQAQHFCQTVPLDSYSLPPVLDLEQDSDLENAVLVEHAWAWLEQVRYNTGHKPMIYTRASYWNQRASDSAGQPPPWSSDYYLWVASYDVEQPSLPLGWQTWTFWQYSEQGRVSGVNGNVDLNWFNGSTAELAAFQSALPGATRAYNAQTGDTLAVVAALHNVSLEKLVEANPQLLQAGAQLQVPVSSAPIYYTVQPGDNLRQIAWRFGLTLYELAQANAIQDADQIWAGQSLRIP